jgi:photosystem II stability/assembly factor-like uncharacterized protein
VIARARRSIGVAAALVLGAALPSCRAGAPFVRVELVAEGVGAVSQIQLAATFGGNSANFAVPAQPAAAPIPFPNSFTVQLPAGAHGQLALLASARDGSGAEVATGGASTGVDGNGDYDVTLVLRGGLLDGGTDDTGPDLEPPLVWTKQASNTAQILLNFWGSGPDDIYLVGWTGTILHSINRGSNWSIETSNTMQNLIGIWGSSPNNIYIVGNGGTILHSTGNGVWTAQNSGTLDLYSVWGTGPTDVWISGKTGTLLHSSGGAWSAQNSTSSKNLWSVWGSGTTLLISGDMGTVLRSTNGGMNFTPGVTSTMASLTQLWGSTLFDAYVAGTAGTLLHSADGGLNWMALTTNTSQDLVCVWGSGASDVFVVGAGGTILHSSNGSWLPMSSGVTTSLFTVWGSGPGDVYAAGDKGVILHLQ